MIKIIDQRLWIAVHLLYPNSSQASDIYHTLVTSVPKKNSDEYAKSLFVKLENFFLKTPAVRSGQPFAIFETNNLQSWADLYQKSLKQHLLVIIGLIIFQFSVEDVSQLLRISQEKTRFLVNQAFKKVIQLDLKDPDLNTEFKFKKAVDKKVSYFFTNENLVEYCLDILDPKDKEAVDNGLRLYPQLIQLQKRYLKIIDELKALLTLNISPSEPIQTAGPNDPVATIFPKPFLQNKKLVISVSGLTIALLAFIIIRPLTFSKSPFKAGGSSIKMIEVNSQPYLTEKDFTSEEDIPPVNLNEMPVREKKEAGAGSESKPKESLPAANSTVAVSTPPVVAKTPPVSQKIPPKIEPAAAGKQGGLYRASIEVTDIDTVTSRITEKLVLLGGKKAGEVELGWKKSAKVSYYHISFPTDNIEEAKLFLNKFGKLSIQFENHPRMMPPGMKRMILEVKEGD